nr:LPD1 domain-containing protein [Methylomarinum sp. Ch1-1]MDP4523172.1 LPD1 domain-containing protein [Methylomarinum sp. Ch1-1]
MSKAFDRVQLKAHPGHHFAFQLAQPTNELRDDALFASDRSPTPVFQTDFHNLFITAKHRSEWEEQFGGGDFKVVSTRNMLPITRSLTTNMLQVVDMMSNPDAKADPGVIKWIMRLAHKESVLPSFYDTKKPKVVYQQLTTVNTTLYKVSDDIDLPENKIHIETAANLFKQLSLDLVKRADSQSNIFSRAIDPWHPVVAMGMTDFFENTSRVARLSIRAFAESAVRSLKVLHQKAVENGGVDEAILSEYDAFNAELRKTVADFYFNDSILEDSASRSKNHLFPGAFSHFNHEVDKFEELVKKYRDKVKDNKAKQKQSQVRQRLSNIEVSEDVNRDNVKHNDVGERIPGARKDYYKYVTSGKLTDMSLDEKITHINKASVWPKPDYFKMIELGAERSVVYFIKKIRDAIDSEPRQLETGVFLGRHGSKRPFARTENEIDSWVHAVELIKNGLENVRTTDDLYASIDVIYEKLSQTAIDGTRLEYRHSPGNRFKKTFADAWHARNQLYRIVNRFGSKGPQDSFFGARKPSGDSKNDTESQKTKLKMPFPAHLKNLKRAGEDYRKEVNIVGDDLIKVFGFKWVEYGEWVNQKERQQVLNFAYDAMMDLAYALGVEPSFIGLNGRLSIGFGSRGRGGRALAHYEPLNKVMNLTKIRGAGSLAHEYFHAFDHYLGDLTGIKDMKTGMFSKQIMEMIDTENTQLKHALHNIERAVESGLAGKEVDITVKNMAHQMATTVLQAMYKEANSKSVFSRAYKHYKKAAEHMHSWSVFCANRFIEGEFEDDVWAVKKHIPDSKTFVPQLITHMEDYLDQYSYLGKAKQFMCQRAAELVADAIKKYDNRIISEEQLKEIADTIQHRYQTQKAADQAFHGFTWLNDRVKDISCRELMGETDYLQEAKKLDGKSRSYWSEPHEIMARAFAVVVYDRLTNEKRRNDYLVRGSEPMEFSDKSLYKGNPNPEGDEREQIGAGFNALFAEMTTHSIAVTENIEPEEGIRVTG